MYFCKLINQFIKNFVMSEIITVGDKKFVKYISQKEIEAAIDRVAEKVNKEYENDIPLIIFVLNGSIIFGADLLKRLTIQCNISCIRVKSYEGMSSTANVRSVIGIEEKVEGRRILIVDDIIDTGNTYEYLVNMFTEMKAKDVKLAALTYKPESYKKPYPLDFVGMEIPNKFIVGYGMDYNELGRNLPDIYQVVSE